MIAAILAQIWPWLVGVAGAIVALFMARRSGVRAEKQKQIIQKFKANEKTRGRIDNAKPAKNAATARANLADWMRKRGK